MRVNNVYYFLKPLIPRWMQIILRRRITLLKRRLNSDKWPIDYRTCKPPEEWSGWPHRNQFALILTHDVETARGHEKCRDLMLLEKELGFRSCFYFVPERYKVSRELLRDITNQGFEVGIHGLKHDGKLYKSRDIFRKRAIRINHYLKEWNAVGFRSPSMHYNLDWLHDLSIDYDSSTFDTDPFEPHPKAVATIFPFWKTGNPNKRGYVEIPYTLPQDFTLFILMREKNIDIWKRKLDWIHDNGGMALVNTHPDYMNFGRDKKTMELYPVRYYLELLEYVRNNYEGQYWHTLPKDLAGFWLQAQMKGNS